MPSPAASGPIAADSSKLIRELLLALSQEFEKTLQFYEATAEKNDLLKLPGSSGAPCSDAVATEACKDLEFHPSNPQWLHRIGEGQLVSEEASEGFGVPQPCWPSRANAAPLPYANNGSYRDLPNAWELPLPLQEALPNDGDQIANGSSGFARTEIEDSTSFAPPKAENDDHSFAANGVSPRSPSYPSQRDFAMEEGDHHEQHRTSHQKKAGFARNSRASGSSHSLLSGLSGFSNSSHGRKLTKKLKHLAQRFAHPGTAQYTSEGSEGAGPSRAETFMKSMYRSVWFEPVLASMIMMNAFAMFAELQYEGIQLGYNLQMRGSTRSAADAWPNAKSAFYVLEWGFGTIFAIEMIFRMTVTRCSFFTDVFNWLDLIIVSCFLIERTVGSIVPVGTQWIRICRFMRLGRLLTLARTVEGFDHLFLITTAIKGSFGILAWSLLLLLVLHMTIALLMGRILHETYFETLSNSPDTQQRVYKYFGTWTRAMLSAFEISLANWTPICRMLTEEVSEWFGIVCLMHKLTVGFAVVGVINGVFMKETFKVAETDDIIMVRQRAKTVTLHEKNMEHLFEALDGDGDGRISKKEWRSLSKFPTVKTWLASMELQTDDLDLMFKLMDEDGDGSITLQELMQGVARLKGSARSIDLLTFYMDHRDKHDLVLKKMDTNGIVSMASKDTLANRPE